MQSNAKKKEKIKLGPKMLNSGSSKPGSAQVSRFSIPSYQIYKYLNFCVKQAKS